MILLLAAIHGAALYAALHTGTSVSNVVVATVCLLIIVVGNYLGKTRSMFLAGVRTPWTLTSEYSWQRTHSLAGKLFIAAGVGAGHVDHRGSQGTQRCRHERSVA